MFLIERVNPKSKIELKILVDLIDEIYREVYFDILKKDVIDYILSFVELETLKNKIVIDDCELYFIKENRDIVGFLELKADEKTVYIEKIYLLKEKRNKKIGKFILNSIYNMFKNRKFSVSINKKLKNAHNFFEKNGFKFQKESAKYIGDEYFLHDKVYIKQV